MAWSFPAKKWLALLDDSSIKLEPVWLAKNATAGQHVKTLFKRFHGRSQQNTHCWHTKGLTRLNIRDLLSSRGRNTCCLWKGAEKTPGLHSNAFPTSNLIGASRNSKDLRWFEIIQDLLETSWNHQNLLLSLLAVTPPGPHAFVASLAWSEMSRDPLGFQEPGAVDEGV